MTASKPVLALAREKWTRALGWPRFAQSMIWKRRRRFSEAVMLRQKLHARWLQAGAIAFAHDIGDMGRGPG